MAADQPAKNQRYIHDLPVDDYFHKSVTLDSIAISAELDRIPADIAYVNHQYAVATKTEAEAELHRDNVRAEVYRSVRELHVNDTKKPTETALDAEIQLDVRMQSAEETLIGARFQAQRLKGWSDAVRAKKDMATSQALLMRAEMGGDMALRDQSRAIRQQAEQERFSAPPTTDDDIPL